MTQEPLLTPPEPPILAGVQVSAPTPRPAVLRVGRFELPAWWPVVLGTGIGAGLVGIGLTLLLHLVQHVAFGYTENTFLFGVLRATPPRRVLVLLVGGLVAGGGWWLLRGHTRIGTVNAAVSTDARPLPVVSTAADSCLQVVVVGLGASLGREGAPRQLAAAVAGRLAERCRLDAEQRRIVIAAGAGAGLAAVYNVPLGGCLFAAEVLLRSMSPRVVIPAALASAIATAMSWLVLPDQPTYQVPAFPLTASLLVCSLLIGPLAGLAGAAFTRLMAWARAMLPQGWRLLAATTIAFTAMGALAIPYPALLGNGKGPTQLALTGALGLGGALALFVLKPLATAACLRSGATGGLLTPSLATGALLGAAAGIGWSHLWPGSQLGAFALIGAAAMLSVTQQAPLCSIVLVLELTHVGTNALVPLVIAVAGALITSSRMTAKRPDRRQVPTSVEKSG
ncbi:MAG TPA: chloride channel protein [Pseudonocardiaceae bacterium]|nr:chloride channel protein [Pseudonocardiaceae bacterium]